MAIRLINQLAIPAVFTPGTGAIQAGDNANVALQKLQGAKANLVSTPTNGNLLNTDGAGQPVDSGVVISTDTALGGGNTAVPTAAAVASYVTAHQAGLALKEPVTAATTAALPANSISGLTLVADANGAFPTIDGVAAAINNSYLVKNEANQAKNGIYTLTTVGDASNPYVLTRRSDANTWTKLIGAYSLTLNGTVNQGDGYVCNIAAGGTLGVTDVTFIKFLEGSGYTAGTGLTLSGAQFSVTNTAVTAAAYGSASQVPTYTVNAQGQLTAAANVAIAIAGEAVTSGTVADTYLPSYMQFSYNGTATNSFNASYMDQTFNADLTIDVSTMTQGLAYSFLASGQDVVITLTNGTLEGYTAAGSTTTQTISSGSVMEFKRVASSKVRLM